MTIKNAKVEQIFTDLENYQDYCRFEGKVYNEAALYNRKDANWQAYERYLNYNEIAIPKKSK